MAAPEVERWRCAECSTVQLDWDDENSPNRNPDTGTRMKGPHGGFCPECGPTIVELKHDCKIPQDEDAYPWTCPVCLVERGLWRAGERIK